jgi:hypothetical protein
MAQLLPVTHRPKKSVPNKILPISNSNLPTFSLKLVAGFAGFAVGCFAMFSVYYIQPIRQENAAPADPRAVF